MQTQISFPRFTTQRSFPTSVTSGNPSGVHTTTANTYDFNTGLVGTATDANNQTTTAYYNSDSLRLEHVTSPGGGATYFTYSDWLTNDAASSYHFYIKTSTKLDNNGSGGATRYVDAYTYFDGRGAVARTMSAADADGWSARDVEYDTMGRAYRSSNPYYASAYSSTPLSSSNMFWTTSTFDHLGRVTQVTMPRGDNNNSLTTNVQISYAGVFTTVTDQAGKVRRQKVDALGRVIRLDEPTTAGLGTTATPNQATNYYYDVLDNLVRINQGSQNRYFKYDSLSRLIRERAAEQTVNASYNLSDALTGNSSWTRKIEYNSSGLVTNEYDARGVQTTFSYDELNRVTQVSYSDATPAAHYYYDAQNLPAGAPSTSAPDNYARGSSTGRLVAMTYGAGATGTYFGYDTAGRVVQQFQLTGSTPAKYKLSYAYNYAGLSTGETYPSGRAMSYSYDNGGRLSQVRDATTIFANSLAYAAHGGLTSETWGNTAVHAVTYNRRLQASQVKLNLGTNVQQQYDYGYGEFNPSTGAVDTSKNNNQLGKITATIGATPQWNQGFSYDELGRLSNLTEHQGGTMTTQTYSQSYAYDRYGNRTQSANSLLGLLAVSAADYNTANNRFVSSVAGYDNSGNITSDLKFRSYTYAYDANGRQRTVSASGNTLESATYDAAGQRVQTVAGSSYRTFVYDIFGQLVADYNGSSGATLESENIYRGRQLLAQYKPGTGLSYVLTDVQGSARTTMNNSGSASTVIARHDYLPFGEELAAGIGLRTAGQGYSGADYNRQKYALTERDEVTGLDHTWWRKYESLSGRWTSPDPLGGSIGDPQSFNRYSYVNNNPVNIVDPTGLEPCIWDPPSGNYCIYGGPDHSPIDNGDPHTRYLDNFDPWGGFGAGRGIGGGVGGAGGVGAGIGATVPQNPEPKRNCTFPTYDQLSAAQQGLLDAGTYGGLSDAQRANFLNQTGALAKAGINLGKATLQEGGILTDRLLFSPGTSLGVFKGSIEAAIASGKFIKDTPVASKHPGMSDFGARQNRTFNALQVGFGSAGAFVDIDRGNPSGGLAGLIVHGAEVLTPGKTDPFAVGKDLGKKVTGYTCK